MRNKPYSLYDNPQITDLKDMIRERAEEEPEAIAFSYSKGKDEVIGKTSAEFSRNIDAFGTYLFSLGIQGKHIAIAKIFSLRKYDCRTSVLPYFCCSI